MTDEERELRGALGARAAEVPVGRADEPGLAQRLVVARRRRRRTRAAGAAIAAVAVLGAASLVAAQDNGADKVVTGPAPSSTSSTEPTAAVDTTLPDATLPPPSTPPSSAGRGPTTTTSSAPTTGPPTTRTTTTAAPLPAVPDDAIWPPPGSTTTFSTPERAALDFARRFLAMGTPQLSPGRVSADGNDATVDIRPLPTGGLTTTALLRKVGTRGWVVVGCNAASILIDQPALGATVGSPLTVRGRAQAFEGHVAVEVRSDGATTPIGQSYGTGGGTDVLPFESTVTFTRPSAPRGTVVVSEPRADVADQGPAGATVVRVAF